MSFNLEELDRVHAFAVADKDTMGDHPTEKERRAYVACFRAYPFLAARLRALEAEVKAARELLDEHGEDTYLGEDCLPPMGLQQDYEEARKATDATGGVT